MASLAHASYLERAMTMVRQVLWRQVTDADFLCVERSTENTPESGGGQTYFSLSFGDHLDIDDFAGFLGVEPPSRLEIERPNVSLDVAVLSDPTLVEAVEFMPRYKNRPDNRYRIARQNRQRPGQARHPAWTVEKGFPIAPDDVSRHDDPRIPDLSQLKLIIALGADGRYFADYVNADRLPTGAPDSLAPLFVPNRSAGPDGLLDFLDQGLSIEGLATIMSEARLRPRGNVPSAPEIEDAQDATARAAGARSRRGQGFRQSAEERAAIDTHAMSVATEHLEAEGWEVEDRSINHPYDLFCARAEDWLHVEVKGTTSDGASVLLTPNEVEFARQEHPRTALLIVHGVELRHDADGHLVVVGGSVKLIEPWAIDQAGNLKPTGYVYTLS